MAKSLKVALMVKEKKSTKQKKSSDIKPKAENTGKDKVKETAKDTAKVIGKAKNIAQKDTAGSMAKNKGMGKAENKGAVATLETPTSLTSTGAKVDKVAKVAKVTVALKAQVVTPDVAAGDDLEVVLTDAEGRRYCRATDCDQIGVVDGYCRYHYLYFWKKIQNRKKILADGKLNRYIEELTSRYTDKFVELLRKDLRTEKDFMSAVQELELDDSASASAQDEDETKTYIEEISGVAPESSTRDDDGY